MSRTLVLDQFDGLTRANPQTPLVVSPSRSWSVGDVDALSRQLVRDLQRSGVERGAGIGLMAPNGPGFLAGFIAILRVDCVVALIDSRTRQNELRSVARTLRLRGLLVCDDAWPLRSDDFRFEAPAEPSSPSPAHAFASDVAVIRLTSGSSGAPRGILVSADGVLADDDQLESTMGLLPDERILAGIPLSHSYGFSSIVLPAVRRGSAIVVPEEDGGPFAPIAAAERCAATFVPTVPAFLAALVKRADPPVLPGSVRLIVSAGAPLPPQTASRFREIHGRGIHVFYGASECGGITYDRGGTAGERGTVGVPVDGVSIELEPGTGQRAVSGVVVVRSPAVATGYFPDADVEKLVAGRFVSEDLGRLEGDELRLVGRSNDLVNVRGQKVHPAEVEAVVSSMAGVEEVVVVGIDADDDSTQWLRAVVATASGRPGPDEIVRYCRTRLAPYKVPRSVVLVEKIPRNARGKIDRVALRRND